jgi:NADH-quinone oxidoreductase subunit E
MVQIGKDYYEDLTQERFAALLDAFARGEVPRPGPQNGRFASEPLGGPTSLAIPKNKRKKMNGSVALAAQKGDGIARITGSETPVKLVDLRQDASS